MAKNAGDVRAGGASVTIGADDTPFRGVIGNVEARLKSFGANAAMLGAKLAGLGVGLGVGLFGVGKALTDVKSKMPVSQLASFADQVAAITDVDKKASLVKSIFGDSGAQLIPLLNQGSAGLAELTKEATKLGLVLSDEDSAAANKLGKSFDYLAGSVTNVTTKVGATLAPLLGTMVDYLTGAVDAVGKFVAENKKLAPQAAVVAAGITAIGAALAVTGGLLWAFGPAIKVSMGVTTVAYYTFAAAAAVVTAAVAVTSAGVKSLSVVGYIAAAAFRVLAATTVVFTIAQAACSVAIRATALTIGVTVAALKTMAVVTLAGVGVVTILTASYTTFGGVLRALMATTSVYKGALIGLTAAQIGLSVATSAFSTIMAIVSSPITLAVVAIAGLLAIGVPLIAWFINCTDAGAALAKSIGTAFANIKAYAESAFGGVVKFIEGIPGAVSGSFTSVVSMATAAWGQIATMATSVFSSAKAVFFDLLGTAKTAFKGISDAVSAGDIQLAVDILWAGIQVAWIKGTDAVKAAWDTTSIYLEGAIDVLGTTMGTLWEQSINTMAGAFDKFVLYIRHAMQDASTYIAETLANADPTGYLGDVESIREEGKAQHEMIDKGAKAREEARKAAIANAGDETGALKRAADREARRQAAFKISPELAGKQDEFNALAARAAAGAVVNVDPKAVEAGKAGTVAAAGMATQMNSAAAQARGSAGAASTVAKAVNGSAGTPEKTLTAVLNLVKETKTTNKLLEGVGKKTGVVVQEQV